LWIYQNTDTKEYRDNLYNLTVQLPPVIRGTTFYVTLSDILVIFSTTISKLAASGLTQTGSPTTIKATRTRYDISACSHC
jgi:hypothetical protein